MKRNASSVRLAAALCLLSVGCAQLRRAPQERKAPGWVALGGGAFKEPKGARVFYGVGVISSLRNDLLARQAVDDRALADLGKAVHAACAQLLREEASVKSSALLAMGGARIAERWTDRGSDTHYALVRLDLAAFKTALLGSGQLDGKAKQAVQERAEAVFDSLIK
jgi:hypothetical protein